MPMWSLQLSEHGRRDPRPQTEPKRDVSQVAVGGSSSAGKCPGTGSRLRRRRQGTEPCTANRQPFIFGSAWRIAWRRWTWEMLKHKKPRTCFCSQSFSLSAASVKAAAAADDMQAMQNGFHSPLHFIAKREMAICPANLLQLTLKLLQVPRSLCISLPRGRWQSVQQICYSSR